MSSALQLWDGGPATPPALVAEAAGAVLELAELEERARGYEANSKSANTWRAYRSDLRHFGAWCERLGMGALPAE